MESKTTEAKPQAAVHHYSEHFLAEQQALKLTENEIKVEMKADKKVESKPVVEAKTDDKKDLSEESTNDAEREENKRVAATVNADIDNDNDNEMKSLISHIKTVEEYDQDIKKTSNDEYKERNMMIK